MSVHAFTDNAATIDIDVTSTSCIIAPICMRIGDNRGPSTGSNYIVIMETLKETRRMHPISFTRAMEIEGGDLPRKVVIDSIQEKKVGLSSVSI